MRKTIVITVLFLLQTLVFSQTAAIKGKVYNAINNEPIPFATVGITSIGAAATTDINGMYEIKNLNPGLYNLSVSCVGFKKKNIFEINAKNFTPTVVDIALSVLKTQY